MQITVADSISPSYFVAIAAVQLGFFREEGVDMEFVFTPADPSQALRDGVVDFYGGSPYTGLHRFPGWRGGAVLCALSQYTYWFLAVRSDLTCERGDVSAVKGLRISASVLPGLTLKRVLEEAGLDLQKENVRIVPSLPRTSQNWAWDGVDAIEQGIADGYWGNGLRADLGVKRGIARILLDVRRGDGPPAARHFTFPALITTERLVKEQPKVAAAAVRAIVKTQKALKADPQLAAKAAQRLFRGGAESHRVRDRARCALLRPDRHRGDGRAHQQVRARGRHAGRRSRIRPGGRDAARPSLEGVNRSLTAWPRTPRSAR
jgi:ABC-type nitrate/sulfonate/bicarbonate transport system substrate-binding protein